MKKSLLTIICILAFSIEAGAVPAAPEVAYITNGLNITVTWSEVQDATGYKLYYAPYPYGGEDTISNIFMSGDTSFSVGLWEGAKYYIAATAMNDSGESSFSNIELFTVGEQDLGMIDADSDGYSEATGDCNDTDATIKPGAEEVCGDSIDQNCSGYDARCSVASRVTGVLPTGQTVCYDDREIVACEGTGQDAEFDANPLSFTNNGNGTLTDNLTGLIWQQVDDSQLRNWFDAEEYCRSYSPDGIDEWRLPIVEELTNIISYSHIAPTISPMFINTKGNPWSETPDPGYWTSTPGPTYPTCSNCNYDETHRWIVDFMQGYVDMEPIYSNREDASDGYNLLNVRCVR